MIWTILYRSGGKQSLKDMKTKNEMDERMKVRLQIIKLGYVYFMNIT